MADPIAVAGQVTSPTTPISATQNASPSWGPYPIMTGGMTFTEVGSAGLRQFGGWVREEFLPQLQGRQAAQKYREMHDNSPIIAAMMSAIFGTMRKVEWRMNP